MSDEALLSRFLAGAIDDRSFGAAVKAVGGHLETATDYVRVGRRAALTLHFQRLITDLEPGLAALSRNRQAPDRSIQ